MLKRDFLRLNGTLLNNKKLQTNLTSFSQTKELKSSIFVKILRSKDVLSKTLSDMFKDDIPMVLYKLQQPIRSKLFNHKTFVKSYDINSFIQNETILSSHCKNSLFIEPAYGHILTRDLRNNKH